MNQSIRIEQAQKSKRLLALLLDLIILAISTLALFFLSFYAIFGPAFNYSKNNETIANIETQYEINLPSNSSYEEFERVVQDFYFKYYTEEITTGVKNNYPNETYSSIVHIYNVFVLNLPREPQPTGGQYKSDYYQYKVDNGVVLVNEIGEKRTDKSGETFDNNLYSYMKNKYEKLNSSLYAYNVDYRNAIDTKSNTELLSRTAAVTTSVIVFAIVIPLIFKNGQTIGDKIFNVAFVRNKNGFLIKPYHTILRGISLYILPIIGVILFNSYSLVLLTIFPIFISTLLMLFRNSNRGLDDILSGTLAVDSENTLFFKSAGEEYLYEKNEINQIVDDPEYLDKLKNVSKIELETSRDEQFKNKNK